MDKVFGTIAMGHFSVKRGFCAEVRELVEKLVPLTRLLWMSTKVSRSIVPATLSRWNSWKSNFIL